MSVCPQCGQAVGKMPAEEEKAESQKQEVLPQREPLLLEKKKKKRTPVIVAAVIILLAALGLGGFYLVFQRFSDGVEEKPLMVLQEDDLYLLVSDKGEKVRLQRNLYDAYPYGFVTEKGKGMLLFCHTGNNEHPYTLSYVKLGDPEARVKNVTDRLQYWNWDVTDDGKVAYIDGEEKLFFGPFSDTEYVDNDVSDFMILDGGKGLMYLTYDGDIYLKDGSGDPERFGRNCEELGFASKNRKTLLWLDCDGSIYCRTLGHDKKELVSYAKKLVSAADDLSHFIYVDKKGRLCRQKGSKEPEILFNRECQVEYVSGKNIFFIQASEEDERGDLYVFDGKDYELLAEDAAELGTEFWVENGKNSWEILSATVKNHRDRFESHYWAVSENGYFPLELPDSADIQSVLCDKGVLYVSTSSAIYAAELSESKGLSGFEKVAEYPEQDAFVRLFCIFKGQPVYSLGEGLYWGNTAVCDNFKRNTGVLGQSLYYTAGDDCLYRFDGEKNEAIAEDVHHMFVCGSKLYFIGDYDRDWEEGSLFVMSRGRTPKKILNEVQNMYLAY